MFTFMGSVGEKMRRILEEQGVPTYLSMDFHLGSHGCRLHLVRDVEVLDQTGREVTPEIMNFYRLWVTTLASAATNFTITHSQIV